MTKLVGEKICDAFARKKEIQVASLRFAGIATDEQYPVLLEGEGSSLAGDGGVVELHRRESAAAASDWRWSGIFPVMKPSIYARPKRSCRNPPASLLSAIFLR